MKKVILLLLVSSLLASCSLKIWEEWVNIDGGEAWTLNIWEQWIQAENDNVGNINIWEEWIEININENNVENEVVAENTVINNELTIEEQVAEQVLTDIDNLDISENVGDMLEDFGVN